VTALVTYFFSAGGALLLLSIGALWIWRRPRSIPARRFLLTVTISYSVLSVYGISYATSRLLVAGFRPFATHDVRPGRTAIVVLGSGTFTARNWDDHRFAILDRPAASRVLEAYRLFTMTDAAWVISSGGLVFPSELDEPSGETMRQALIRLGVPAARILVETKSRTTHDEAVIVRGMLASLDVQTVILVTSDIHMRRSIGAFRAEGIVAVPAIARHPGPNMPRIGWFLPSQSGLDEAEDAWHEILGIAYYFARGWYR
jgi:uncharacterized SAM-binding protein YcdF (DUF218 family)